MWVVIIRYWSACGSFIGLCVGRYYTLLECVWVDIIRYLSVCGSLLYFIRVCGSLLHFIACASMWLVMVRYRSVCGSLLYVIGVCVGGYYTYWTPSDSEGLENR